MAAFNGQNSSRLYFLGRSPYDLDRGRCYNQRCTNKQHLAIIDRKTGAARIYHTRCAELLSYERTYISTAHFGASRRGASSDRIGGWQCQIATSWQQFVVNNTRMARTGTLKIPGIFNQTPDMNYNDACLRYSEQHGFNCNTNLGGYSRPVMKNITVGKKGTYSSEIKRVANTVSDLTVYKKFAELVGECLVYKEGSWVSRGRCPGPVITGTAGSTGAKRDWLNTDLRVELDKTLQEVGAFPYVSTLEKPGDVKSDGTMRTVYPVNILQEYYLRKRFGVAHTSIKGLVSGKDKCIIGSLESQALELSDQSYKYYDIISLERKVLPYYAKYVSEAFDEDEWQFLLPPVISKGAKGEIHIQFPDRLPSGILLTSLIGNLFTLAVADVCFRTPCKISGDAIATIGLPTKHKDMFRRTEHFNKFVFGNNSFSYVGGVSRLTSFRNKSFKMVNGRTLFELRHWIYKNLLNADIPDVDYNTLFGGVCTCFDPFEGPLRDYGLTVDSVNCIHGRQAFLSDDGVKYDPLSLVKFFVKERGLEILDQDLSSYLETGLVMDRFDQQEICLGVDWFPIGGGINTFQGLFKRIPIACKIAWYGGGLVAKTKRRPPRDESPDDENDGYDCDMDFWSCY